MTKMSHNSRSIEYLLLSTTLEVSVNGSSVNDEETASLLLFQGKTLIKTTLANIHALCIGKARCPVWQVKPILVTVLFY